MSDTVRILVADDHPLFREGVVNTLTGETDFEVVAEASTGEAAVTLAVELVRDIAILDLTMPPATGASSRHGESQRRLRRRQSSCSRYPRTPTISSRLSRPELGAT